MADKRSSRTASGDKAPGARSPDNYLHQTLRPLNNLVFVLPLLIAFHLGAAHYGSDLSAPRIIGQALSCFGATADLLAPMLVAAVLAAQQIARRDPWEVQPKALAGMVAESIAWTIPLIAMHQLTGRLVAAPALLAAAQAAEGKLLQLFVGALGAGVYEEFLFRLLLIGLIVFVFVDIFSLRKTRVTAVAICVSAVCFGLCHFSISQLSSPGSLDWPKLVFLVVAGLLWGCLYVYRGFGIAAGAHAMWDMYVAVCRS